MNTIKFIAACALCICSGATLGHEKGTSGSTTGTPHAAHANHATQGATAEQKPWGIAGEVRHVTRTITVQMSDRMRFTPSHIEVREGDTVRLRAVNQGKTLHEIVIGTQAELDAHAELMKKHPGMEHDEPYMAHVAAGKRGEILWHFNRPGSFHFACLIAGHYQAGMVGTITVLPRQP